MDSDYIMVMEKGELGEYDAPSKLLADSKGMLSSLIDETGASSSAYLRKIANGERIGSTNDLQSL